MWLPFEITWEVLKKILILVARDSDLIDMHMAQAKELFKDL